MNLEKLRRVIAHNPGEIALGFAGGNICAAYGSAATISDFASIHAWYYPAIWGALGLFGLFVYLLSRVRSPDDGWLKRQQKQSVDRLISDLSDELDVNEEVFDDLRTSSKQTKTEPEE